MTLRLFATYAASASLWRYDLTAQTVERTDRHRPGEWVPDATPEEAICRTFSAIPVSRDEAFALVEMWKGGRKTEGLASEGCEPKFRKEQLSPHYRRPTPTARQRLAELAKWMQTPKAKALMRQQEQRHAKGARGLERWLKKNKPKAA